MCTGGTKAALPPGRSEHLEKAWELKEDIREELGIFNYSREFFTNLYMDEYAYARLTADETDIIGLAIVRKRGYMSLLAVEARRRGDGFGRALLRDSLTDFEEIECTVRESNKRAVLFYKEFGFEIKSVEEGYYDNDENGLHLEYHEA